MKSYFNYKNEPYYSLWTDKNDYQMGNIYGVPYLNGLERKNDFIFKILNKDKKSNNNFIKQNMGKNNNGKLIQTNNYMNNIFDKKIKNSKKNLQKNKNSFNKNEGLNINKEEKNNNDNNENFDEEQEKLFYTNQKNFFKARKDIMEEPEFLEEDNDNNK